LKADSGRSELADWDIANGATGLITLESWEGPACIMTTVWAYEYSTAHIWETGGYLLQETISAGKLAGMPLWSLWGVCVKKGYACLETMIRNVALAGVVNSRF
jgi:hypothetical protein